MRPRKESGDENSYFGLGLRRVIILRLFHFHELRIIMPAETQTAVLTPAKSKPAATRSSIRRSLNFASMSKALVDVISKDSKDTTKNAKKVKDSSRRSSTFTSHPPPAAPRASMGDIIRPLSQVAAKRAGTPDSKTVTRRRVSGSYARSSSDEQHQPPRPSTQEPVTPQPGVQTRSSTLRPKNVNAASSALPKYRPKSVVNDSQPQKPPSPVKSGTRRRLSSSDDERKEQKVLPPSVSPSEKRSRPISPLPQRAALKANLNSINVTPSTPSKVKPVTHPSPRLSPSRPTKIVKTSASSTVPRPPSSSSSIASLYPNGTPKSSKNATPKASGIKSKFGLSRSGNDVKSSGMSSKMPFSRDSPSPLSRHSRQPSKKTTPNASVSNMSHISEVNSESDDSDLENVELLLAPVAALGAPTPAMPRIHALKKRSNPQTPSKSRLPTRENLSYVSPDPPGSNKSNSSLRPPVRPMNSEAVRGSILSWEQLAADASRTMDQDELGRMLADVPAPFQSGAASPALSSHLGLPDSPALSVIDSPGGGYGSISQVLLPEVTPSPAVHHHGIQHHKYRLTPDASKSAVDSSTVTLVKLQLASMENTARERLFQIQAMEEEMHNLKQVHAYQMEEMHKQLQYMESQSRTTEERASNIFKAALEEHLRQQRTAQEETFQQTVMQFQENARLSHRRALDVERARMKAESSASLAASKWGTVTSACEVELNLVHADRATLTFLLAQVDQMSAAL